MNNINNKYRESIILCYYELKIARESRQAHQKRKEKLKLQQRGGDTEKDSKKKNIRNSIPAHARNGPARRELWTLTMATLCTILVIASVPQIYQKIPSKKMEFGIKGTISNFWENFGNSILLLPLPMYSALKLVNYVIVVISCTPLLQEPFASALVKRRKGDQIVRHNPITSSLP